MDPNTKVTVDLPHYGASALLAYIRENKDQFQNFLNGRDGVEYSDESYDIIEMELASSVGEE